MVLPSAEQETVMEEMQYPMQDKMEEMRQDTNSTTKALAFLVAVEEQAIITEAQYTPAETQTEAARNQTNKMGNTQAVAELEAIIQETQAISPEWGQPGVFLSAGILVRGEYIELLHFRRKQRDRKYYRLRFRRDRRPVWRCPQL